MRILVQNLTRFGDLIQSQPALAELAGQGHELAVACLENFTGAARLLPEAGTVFPLPGARFLSGLAGDWREALASVTAFADTVARDFAPEAVVNLTPALSARLLARRLCGDAVSGFSLDPEGFRRESNLWAAFLEASSADRRHSPFNVVDVFRKAAGVGRGRGRFSLRRPAAAALKAARTRMAGPCPADTAFFVGLQLGASAEVRQWPVASFVRLGETLHERHRATMVLLGGPGEKKLAQAYLERCTVPAVDLVGETSLEELAAVLCGLRLLVTNDTGTLHLAAGLDIPSIAIFLATAQPFDTGPYREGCLCLEPDMPCHPCDFGSRCPYDNVCRQHIGADTVADAAAAFFAGRGFAPGAYPGARAWLSAFDDQGFMALASLSGHDAAARAVWLRLERHVFRQFLDEEDVRPSRELMQALPLLTGPEGTEVSGVLRQSADLLGLIEAQAGLAARNPAMKSRFLASWERLRLLWAASAPLGVLARLWQREAQESSPDMSRLLSRIRRFAAVVAALRALVDRA